MSIFHDFRGLFTVIDWLSDKSDFHIHLPTVAIPLADSHRQVLVYTGQKMRQPFG